MQRWEFFLNADRARDLADFAAGMEWVSGTGFAGIKAQVLGSEKAPTSRRGEAVVAANRAGSPEIAVACFAMSWAWKGASAEDAEAWRKAVESLRSVARRVRNFRGRKANIDQVEADGTAAEYLSLLVPTLPAGGKPLRTLAGLRHRPRFPEAMSGFSEPMSLFWQIMFGSLLDSDIDPVCGDCGRPLGLTPNGRPRRAARCPKCNYKSWLSALTDSQRKELWRKQAKAKATSA